MNGTHRHQFSQLVANGAIASDAVPDAVNAAGLYPRAGQWRVFLSQLTLWLGSLALAVALIFFIAYNWQHMGVMFRFALVELALLGAVAVAWAARTGSVAYQAALMVASLCLGGLLALYGQTYQTGADPWQLFFNWAILMLPWALLGRFAAIWLLWLMLLNIAAVQYHSIFDGLFTHWLGEWLPAERALFLLNTLALVVWEAICAKVAWLRLLWARRTIAVASGAAATVMGATATYSALPGNALVVLFYAAWVGVAFGWYRYRRPDLFCLAGLCLSVIIVTTFWLADMLFAQVNDAAGLLVAIAVLAMSTGAALWLRQLEKEMSQ